MSSNFNPKQFAHSVAIDALRDAMHNQFDELDGLTLQQEELVVEEMHKLCRKLADEVNLDIF